MNEEEINKEIYSNLKYKVAPDEADKAFEARLQTLRGEYFDSHISGGAELQIRGLSATGPEAKVISLKTYLKWATGIAAILLIGLFVWAPWNANLYDNYAISRKISVAERGERAEDALSRAANEYNAEDYAAAKPLFAEAYANKPNDAMVGYYYAITLIETAEEDKGRAILHKLYDGESVFKYESAFYIALSYIKQNRKQEAKQWLEKIPEGTVHDEAVKELKDKLN